LKSTARGQLENCRIANMRLLDWLRAIALVKADEKGWEAVKRVSGSESDLTGIAGQYCLTDKTAAETILVQQAPLLGVHLADAVLAAMARKNRGGKR